MRGNSLVILKISVVVNAFESEAIRGSQQFFVLLFLKHDERNNASILVFQEVGNTELVLLNIPLPSIFFYHFFLFCTATK